MQSARLYYRPICPAHAPMLEPVLCDPLVYQFIDAPCPSLAELSESFRHKEIGAPASDTNERWINYAVFQIDNHHAIGRVEATVVGRRAEVAYLFGRAYWGMGFASEAMSWFHGLLASDHGVGAYLATVDPKNHRSIRVLHRLGYREDTVDRWPNLGSYDSGDLVFSRLDDSL